jgi:cation:H+ antiporter
MLAQILLSFAIGIGAILVASKIFIVLSEEFSAKWKVSQLFVAVVVVALSTSLPELTVTIAAVVQNDPGLAIGNSIGSSITNLALIFGLTTVFGTITIGTKKTQISALLLSAVVVLFVLLQLIDVSNLIKGMVLLSALSLSLWYEYVIAVRGRLNEDKPYLKKLLLRHKKPKFAGITGVLALIVSTAGLGIGGMITVNAINQLSYLIGISTTILGLGLNSLATTLPELMLVISASQKKMNKVVVGTLIGSNIFNLTLLPAIIYLFSAPPDFLPAQLAVLCAVTLIFVSLIFRYRGKEIPLFASALLLLSYVIFFVINFESLV